MIQQFLYERHPDVVHDYEHPINRAFLVLHNIGHDRHPEAWDWGDPNSHEQKMWEKLNQDQGVLTKAVQKRNEMQRNHEQRQGGS
jgi:hypothetical protein